MALHAGLTHRLAFLDITGPYAKAEPTARIRAALAQNISIASSRASAMQCNASPLDVALVVADVVILLERSVYHPFSCEKTGARTKASLLEIHASDVWLRADKQRHEVVKTGGRTRGIWAVRKGDHIRVGMLTRSEPIFVHFVRFHVHHADYLSVEDSIHDALFYNESNI